MNNLYIFALLSILSFLVWLIAFKLEDIFSIKEKGRYTTERVESAEYSSGNPLLIGFEYFPFAIIALASEAILLSTLIFGFNPYVLLIPLIGTLLIWKMK